jgi:hypothetical protein
MPIFLRNFTWNKMKQWYEEQNKEGSDDVVSQSISNMKMAGGMYNKAQSNKR